MALPGITESHRAVGGGLLVNRAAARPLRGGWNASDSVAGFDRNHRLASVGIAGWHPSDYADRPYSVDDLAIAAGLYAAATGAL